MDDDARENAIRILLDDKDSDENRITSARHLGTSSDGRTLDALIEVCSEPEGDEELFMAAGKSLARVAKSLGHEHKVDQANLNKIARAAYTTEAR